MKDIVDERHCVSQPSYLAPPINMLLRPQLEVDIAEETFGSLSGSSAARDRDDSVFVSKVDAKINDLTVECGLVSHVCRMLPMLLCLRFNPPMWQERMSGSAWMCFHKYRVSCSHLSLYRVLLLDSELLPLRVAKRMLPWSCKHFWEVDPPATKVPAYLDPVWAHRCFFFPLCILRALLFMGLVDGFFLGQPLWVVELLC